MRAGSRTLTLLIGAAAAGTLAGCAAPAGVQPASMPASPAPVAEAPAAAAFPTVAPEPGPAPSLRLPAPVRRTLRNGLEVVYVPQGTLPVVHATLVTPGSSTNDPAELPGLAAFVAEMLDEGAGGRDALVLADQLDQLGATLNTGAGWDAAFLDLHVLRSRLPQALQLLADVAARPDFPADQLQRVRDERLTDLTRAADEPRTIASNAFDRLVYGEAHPYGRLPATETTRQIDRAALERFHQRYYRPGGSTLVLAGDVDPGQLHPLVEQAFGAWQGTAAPPAQLPEAPAAGRTTLYLIDKPQAAQSEIRVGHPGVAREDPDYFPLLVLNTVLGGSFTSRLNTNLRETHGFAYGARSAFSMRRGAGPFTASSAVFSAKTDSAVVEFFRELNRIRDEAVAPDELQRAKNYVALGLPRSFETSADVAGQLAELEVYDQDIGFYNDYVQRIHAVSAADVQRVAREYLRPDRAVVVVVGDRASVEPGLRALEIGPVLIRETQEFVR